MKIESYLKLEKEVKSTAYATEWKRLDRMFYYVSYLGNIASMFCASFYLYKIVSGSGLLENPIALGIITLVILVMVEFLKREVFKMFSKQFLRFKNIFTKEVAGLMIGSCLLIFGSFFLSLNGAHDFANRQKQITATTELATDTVESKIKTEYEAKILPLTERNNDLFDENKTKEARKDVVTSARERTRIEREIDKNRKEIEANKAEIKTIEAEMKTKISEESSSLEAKSADEIKENNENSSIFVIISTIIETLILIGVYFHSKYEFNSLDDYTDRINSSNKLRKWYIFYRFLTILFNKTSKDNESFSAEELYEAADMNDIITDMEEIQEFYKVAVSNKILSQNDDETYTIIQPEKKAHVKLKQHFGID